MKVPLLGWDKIFWFLPCLKRQRPKKQGAFQCWSSRVRTSSNRTYSLSSFPLSEVLPRQWNEYLVGGFNPLEKYYSIWIISDMKNDSFAQIAMNIHSIWNHHLDNLWFVLGSEVWIRRFHQEFPGVPGFCSMESDILGRIPWTFTPVIRDGLSSFKNHTSRNKYLSASSWPLLKFLVFSFVKVRTSLYSSNLDATCTLADMEVVQELGLKAFWGWLETLSCLELFRCEHLLDAWTGRVVWAYSRCSRKIVLMVCLFL